MRNYPVFVMHDTGLEDLEVRAIREGMEQLSTILIGRPISNYGSSAWCDGDYSSPDWYAQHATKVIKPGGIVQLDANSVLNLLDSEPWQVNNPHIDVFFTSKDLTSRGLNFCFGMARGRVTVQSVARYRKLPIGARKLAIRSVVQHEIGHILGCAPFGRTNVEDNLGPHCTNHGCIMRQGLNLQEWVQHAKDAKAMGRIYCPQCLADIHRTAI